MRALTGILLYIWQLPQNLLGWLLVRMMSPGTMSRYRDAHVLRSPRMHGGISLGCYVVVSSRMGDPDLVRHEWGHCLQSRLLGPLYLPVIGLPSLLWAIWWHPGRKVGYFSFYTERWANLLAGIGR